MKRLGKMIGSQETYEKMSKILKDTLNKMNNHYEDTDRMLEDAGFHHDQDFLKAEHKKHEQVMKHYDNIIKELKEFINTVDTDINEFDKTEYEKVKLHNSNKNIQIIAELPMLDKLPEVEKDERTVVLVANDETYTFIIDAYRNNDVMSIYHEVLSDKEFKNMRITKYEYDNGFIKVWFRC